MSEYRGHKPSQKKLRELRAKGIAAKSPFFTSILGLTICSVSAFWLIRFSWVEIKILLQYSIVDNSPDLFTWARFWVKLAIRITLTAVGIHALVSVCCDGFQVGFKLNPLKLDPGRLGPVSGLRRMTKGLREIWLVTFKLSLVVVIGCWGIWRTFNLSFNLRLSPELSERCFKCSLQSILTVLGTLLLLATLDLWIKKRGFINDNSMTRDELTREHREDHGDPSQKAQRKALHEALLMQDLVRRVRRSRVIVVERQTV